MWKRIVVKSWKGKMVRYLVADEISQTLGLVNSRALTMFPYTTVLAG